MPDRETTCRAGDSGTPTRSGAGARVEFLPHEYVFGFFLILTWVRMVIRAGPFNPPALVYLGCVLVSLGVIFWAGRRPAPWRWRVRLLLYPCLMGLSFFMMPAAITLLGVPRADAMLVQLENGWAGTQINLAIQSWEPPLLTDLLMLCYCFFFYYLIAGPAWYCLHDLPRFRQCFAGLFTLYGLGFIGYTFFPAGGPHRFLVFDGPLAGGWITHAAKPVLDDYSNRVDAFPSIHVAVSLYLLVFDWWYHRRRFWRVLVPCIALWISTVYLRYHYCVDVLAGVIITAIGLVVAANCQRCTFQTPVPVQPMGKAPVAGETGLEGSCRPDS